MDDLGVVIGIEEIIISLPSKSKLVDHDIGGRVGGVQDKFVGDATGQETCGTAAQAVISPWRTAGPGCATLFSSLFDQLFCRAPGLARASPIALSDIMPRSTKRTAEKRRQAAAFIVV
ncbi:MAG: hypothetical protein HY360_03120 [Verrucomicrobia bacterium]|nr:hypothetical protein [Verrucomicrobiota bacterium]